MSSSTEPASASALPPGVTDPNYKPLPGRLGNLTVPQQHALDTLRRELQDEGAFVPARMDDAMLLRFLRARKFDVPKAKAMVLAAEQWRKDEKVDELVQTFDFKEKEEVNKYYPQYYHKIDKEGRPVYIERVGKLDIKALYAITTQERQLQRLVFEYERSLTSRLPASARAVGHPVETFCTILDLGGVSLANFYRVKDYVMAAASIGQDRYPEIMGRFYIVNAPWAFSAVWAVVRPWLDEVTVSKIDILGGTYKDKLLAQIPAENLPKEFGGACECPGGCSLSDAGPWKDEDEAAAAAAGAGAPPA
ncbi:CRAL-TRIO domain-containing protein [Gloeopeniophorella convolvens]|nr:CRAL-TRIO domain-containing protein [Gloeopeniophorella convolvens]